MNLPVYKLKTGERVMTFNFVSEGRKGEIPKMITFTEIAPLVYNISR